MAHLLVPGAPPPPAAGGGNGGAAAAPGGAQIRAPAYLLAGGGARYDLSAICDKARLAALPDGGAWCAARGVWYAGRRLPACAFMLELKRAPAASGQAPHAARAPQPAFRGHGRARRVPAGGARGRVEPRRRAGRGAQGGAHAGGRAAAGAARHGCGHGGQGSGGALPLK